MIEAGDYITEWVSERMPDNLGFNNGIGIGVVKNGAIICGIVYDNYQPALKSIFASIAIDGKIGLQKNFLIQLFEYPFNSLGCKRLNALIKASNQPSINLARRLGFNLEGILRNAAVDDTDLLLFGMLKGECRWLSKNTLNS